MTKALYIYYNLVIPIDIYKKYNRMYINKEDDSLRVISGKARGIKLESLEGENTRPTLDRIKESLFNIIQFNIQDAVVLDLFAGSGSLGIETLSRGAKEVVFCDDSLLAIKTINTNLERTRIYRAFYSYK